MENTTAAAVLYFIKFHVRLYKILALIFSPYKTAVLKIVL